MLGSLAVDHVDHVVVAVTLTGSLLSVLGTLFILFCYLALPHKWHIRHALIVNLTLADFINASNNSISGLWVAVSNKNLVHSVGCTVNGFVGQLSVQAVDFSILTLTIVTVWIILAARTSTELSLGRMLALCGLSWVIPVITSNIALYGGFYGPAASNWCWIDEDPKYLRYALTHGWRFLIIFSVTTMCIYIQIHLRRRARALNSLDDIMTTQPAEDTNPIPSLRALAEKESGIDEDVNYGSDDEGMHYDVIMVNSSTNLNSEKELPATPQATKKGSQLSRTVGPYIEGMRAKLKARLEKAEKAPSRSRQKSVEKAMLLHAYPIFYIILWIPGIAMRIAQVSGHSPYALQVMQASTQYIGFANAITFGWNERIGAQLRAKILGEEMV